MRREREKEISLRYSGILRLQGSKPCKCLLMPEKVNQILFSTAGVNSTWLYETIHTSQELLRSTSSIGLRMTHYFYFSRTWSWSVRQDRINTE